MSNVRQYRARIELDGFYNDCSSSDGSTALGIGPTAEVHEMQNQLVRCKKAFVERCREIIFLHLLLQRLFISFVLKYPTG